MTSLELSHSLQNEPPAASIMIAHRDSKLSSVHTATKNANVENRTPAKQKRQKKTVKKTIEKAEDSGDETQPVLYSSHEKNKQQGVA